MLRGYDYVSIRWQFYWHNRCAFQWIAGQLISWPVKLFLSIVPYQHFLKTSLWLAHDDLSCLDLTAKYLFNRQQNNSMTSNFKTEPHCGFAWSTTETNMLCILGLSLYQKGPIPQIGIELTANETAAEKQLTEGLTRVGLAQVCTECRIYSPL